MKSLKDRSTWQIILQKFQKFASIGIICTVISLSTQTILLKFFQTPLILTYVSVYLCVVLLSYILNSHFTFKSSLSLQKMFLYYLIYLSSMLLGVVLLKIFRAVLPFENWVLPFLVIPFTMVWNFIFASKALERTMND